MANYRAEARRAARRHGLDPNIFERQIQQESGFNPSARSPAGAMGIAQFMPATARGLGVNPNNPTQALDGAAKLMANYVRKYGSYKNALVAYNAGPGRVGGPLPAETQNYIRTILGNKNPSGGVTVRTTTGRNQGANSDPGITIGAGVTTQRDPEAEKRVILANLLQQRDPNNLLLKLGILDPNESTTNTVSTPGITVGGGSTRSQPSSRSSGGSNQVSRGMSPLFELIHNTGTGGPGYAVKNGQRVDGRQVYGSVWNGHRDHVHVAAGPNTIVKLGKLAESMGLHVGENSHFGGVHPVHVKGSYHYKNEAIDVGGDPKKMDQFAHRVERIFGIK